MSLDREYIQKLKLDNSTALMIEENTIGKYRIKILHRGEHLFYYDKEMNRALIVPIEVRSLMSQSIFKNSLNVWDTGLKITEDEKRVITNRVDQYFKNYQKVQAFKDE